MARALTVPMHLGLKNGSFVSHNLILIQESPVTLLKFQMAFRLKLFYVGHSESKYRLRISLAHPPDCHFAHVQ